MRRSKSRHARIRFGVGQRPATSPNISKQPRRRPRPRRVPLEEVLKKTSTFVRSLKVKPSSRSRPMWRGSCRSAQHPQPAHLLQRGDASIAGDHRWSLACWCLSQRLRHSRATSRISSIVWSRPILVRYAYPGTDGGRPRQRSASSHRYRQGSFGQFGRSSWLVTTGHRALLWARSSCRLAIPYDAENLLYRDAAALPASNRRGELIEYTERPSPTLSMRRDALDLHATALAAIFDKAASVFADWEAAGRLRPGGGMTTSWRHSLMKAIRDKPFRSGQLRFHALINKA